MYDKAGVSFYSYKTAQFMEYARDYLESQISDETIEEVTNRDRYISRQEELAAQNAKAVKRILEPIQAQNTEVIKRVLDPIYAQNDEAIKRMLAPMQAQIDETAKRMFGSTK